MSQESVRLPYPLTNVLIDSVSDTVRRKLMSHLERVNVPIRTSLYEPNEPPKWVHFLTSGIASVVTYGEERTIEVGTLGREGAPQAVHLLGSLPSVTRCFMQISGTALRMDYSAFQRLFQSDENLRQILLGYVQYQAMMLAQVAGCNRLHEAEPRLARWLLMIQDRTGNGLLKLTQEFIGEMIGTQRTTVSEVASGLQERGLIEYARGTIRVIDRVGLENIACGCYRVTRNLLSCVYGMAGQQLFSE